MKRNSETAHTETRKSGPSQTSHICLRINHNTQNLAYVLTKCNQQHVAYMFGTKRNQSDQAYMFDNWARSGKLSRCVREWSVRFYIIYKKVLRLALPMPRRWGGAMTRKVWQSHKPRVSANAESARWTKTMLGVTVCQSWKHHQVLLGGPPDQYNLGRAPYGRQP